MYYHFFPCLQIIRSDIWPQANWLVNHAIADGDINVPLGFVWISMG